MPRLVVLVGLPGSGKTSVAACLAGQGWLSLDQDALGPLAVQLCEEALTQGCDVVLDGCNLTMSQRSIWVHLAKRLRAKSCVLHMNTDGDLCLRKLTETVTWRDRPALQSLFATLHSRLEPLALREGFVEGFIAKTVSDVNNFCLYMGTSTNPIPAQLFHKCHQAARSYRTASGHVGAANLQAMLDPHICQLLALQESSFQMNSPTQTGLRGMDGLTSRSEAEPQLSEMESQKVGHKGKAASAHKQHEPQTAEGPDMLQASAGQKAAEQVAHAEKQLQRQPRSRKKAAKGQRKQIQLNLRGEALQEEPEPETPQTKRDRIAAAGLCPEAATGPMRDWGQLPQLWPRNPSQQFPGDTKTENADPPQFAGHLGGTTQAAARQANGAAGGAAQAGPPTQYRPPAMRTKQWGWGPSAVGSVEPPLVPYDLLKSNPSDERAVLLFDLNGTLTSHTAQKKSVGRTKIRPGTPQLRKLMGKFRLGIYTSSSERTVSSVLPSLELAAGFRQESLFQEPQLILYRGHTQHATAEHKAAGGKDWDTVKPLSPYFSKMGRVLLVDDDAYKAVPGEEDNMIVIPGWPTEDPEDTVIEALVAALLAATDNLPLDADLRPLSAEISETVKRVSQPLAEAVLAS